MSVARVRHWAATAPVVCATSAWNGLAFTPWQTWAFRRAELTAFVESPFCAPNGKLITMASIRTLEPRWSGLDRMLRISGAVLERLLPAAIAMPKSARVALVLCLAERYGEGASGVRRREREALEQHLGERLREWGLEPTVLTVGRGHASMAFALSELGQSIADGALDVAIALGVDTLHDPDALQEHLDAGRIFDGENLDSFIPGEGGAAVLVASPNVVRAAGWDVLATLDSVSVGHEAAHCQTELPCAGVGLSRTLLALSDRVRDEGRSVDAWLGDVTNEDYRVHEFQMAFPRVSAGVSRGEPSLEFLPALLGDLGAATLPTAVAIAAESFARGTALTTNCVCFAGSTSGDRGALLLSYERARDRRPRSRG